jgi:hypothetical protein
MKTHDQLVQTLMQRPGIQAEVNRIENEEYVLLEVQLNSRSKVDGKQPDQINASASRACFKRD